MGRVHLRISVTRWKNGAGTARHLINSSFKYELSYIKYINSKGEVNSGEFYGSHWVKSGLVNLPHVSGGKCSS